MDYEKAYKDANNKVASRFGTNVAKEIFTDLYESEDERIRKSLIDFVEQYGDNYYGQIAKASAIAWLEKQGGKLQWKPTDGQMQALELVIQYHTFADQDKREKIVALFNDLKKL